jgi:hypothetical protein
MRFILLLLVLATATVLLNPFLQFWMMMIMIAIVSALSKVKPMAAFFAGGLAMGMGWLAKSMYLMMSTGSPLADRMGELMGIGNGIMLAGITSMLGFLLGGFSALSGSTFRNLWRTKSKNIYRG